MALDNDFLALTSCVLILFFSSSSALASFFLRIATFLAALSYALNAALFTGFLVLAILALMLEILLPIGFLSKAILFVTILTLTAALFKDFLA